MIKKILNSKTKTIAFGAALLSASSFLSQFLGLIRDRLLAGKFGAGPELDIYFAAFKIPDFVYGILIVGGITGAFLPVFSSFFKGKEENGAWPEEALEFANIVLNCFLVVLVLICLILAIFAPYVSKLIIPGFSAENREATVALTRLMFLSPILFGLSAIFSGISQYFHKFFAFALAPILYNLGIIAGILIFSPMFGIYGLAYGVIVGAFLHLAIQLPPVLSSGFKYRPILNLKNKGLKKIFKLMVPRTISSAVFYINIIFITAVASTLASGSVAIFSFSDNIQSFPAMLIGLSFAISAFPMLSKLWAEDKKEEFVKNFASSFRQILFIVVPASIAMFLLRAQIIRLLLGSGNFGWWETQLTAGVLGIFCFSIFANSLIPLLIRTFFSLHDTKTPMAISLITILSNAAFAYLFIFFLSFDNYLKLFLENFLRLSGIDNIKIIALPIALGLSSLLQLKLLLIFLYRKIGDFRIKEIAQSFVKIVFSAIIMGIVVYIIRQNTGGFAEGHTVVKIFFQTIISLLFGLSSYLLTAHMLGCKELKGIIKFFTKRFEKPVGGELENLS